MSRLGKVLEEDRVGGIPVERVAWRVPGRRAPREEVGWEDPWEGVVRWDRVLGNMV